jgi:hypothetical protein
MMEENEHSLPALAAEVFGGEYQPLETSRRALTTEDAFVRLQNKRAEREPLSEPESKPEPRVEAELPQDDAFWSTEDVKTISLLQTETQRFRHDLEVFAQYKAADIDQLSGGDKGKAAAIRVQLAEAERELRQRHDVLAAAESELKAKAQQRITARAEQLLAREKAKLAERVPDLDKTALRAYLLDRGFTAEEIAGAADARLMEMAEKARRYDESQKKPKGKVPKFKKQPEPRANVSTLPTRSTRNLTDMDRAYQKLQAKRAQQ